MELNGGQTGPSEMFRLVTFSKKLVANMKYRESTRKNLATRDLHASRVAAVTWGSSPRHAPCTGTRRPLTSSALPSRLRSPQVWGPGHVLGFPFLVASSRCHRKGSDPARSGFVAQQRGLQEAVRHQVTALGEKGLQGSDLGSCTLSAHPWTTLCQGSQAGHTLEGLRPSGMVTCQLCNYHTWPGAAAMGSPGTPSNAPPQGEGQSLLRGITEGGFSMCLPSGPCLSCLLPMRIKWPAAICL